MGIVLTCGSLFFPVPEVRKGEKTTMKHIKQATCIVLGVLTIYAVWNIAAVRIRVIQAENERQTLSRRIAEISAENRRLEEEILLSEDAATVERVARARLGLVRPGELIFRVIKPEIRERE